MEPEPVGDTKAAESPPTFSHVLAEDSITDPNNHVTHKGSRAERGTPEDRNLDWNTHAARSQPFSDSVTNEDAWTLIRRFNKQVFCVRSIAERPLTALDMNNASVYDTSPERLRAHIERLYMTVFVALYSFYKQLVRLRSWREKPRTLSFLGVYTLTWHIGFLAPTLTIFLIVLIMCPPVRNICFPSIPPALIDAKRGGIQIPLSGQLASDSITGAPEKHKGETIEQEAISFLESISKLMVSISSGKHFESDAHENDWEIAPNPSKIMEGVADVRDKTEADDDKTKKPISQAVQKVDILTLMPILPGFIDSWERLGNALSPTSPFPLNQARMTMAACLLPLLIVLCFASGDTIMKGLGFVIGFYLFGGPAIQRFCELLDEDCPGWRDLIEPRHTVLRGVPTNAQLTVTLLRIGEGRYSPLPPPPDTYQPSSIKGNMKTGDVNRLGAFRDELQTVIDAKADQNYNANVNSKHHGKSKTVRFVAEAIKRTTKGSARAMLKMNQVKAYTGGEHAKQRLGALEAPSKDTYAGPVRFPARYHGEKGFAYITTTATTPAVSWRRETEGLRSAWTVSLADITQLRKEGGLGWQGKGVVGTVLGWEVCNGMALTTKEGNEIHLTAITLRDEMFNRLISIAGHMWEIM